MRQVLGQSRALEQLQAALRTQRLHHAYIFHGPPGIGKFTTALALARIILCHDRRADEHGRIDACGQCESCRLLVAGHTPDAASATAHPDLHPVSKELARFHEDRSIRERKLMNIPWPVLEQFLLQAVYQRPRLGHGKVFIIDEAELIDAGGQNRLLKTLEEPPAGTHIILVTSAEERLLPTLRSRCERVAFAALEDRALERWLDERPEAARLAPAQRRWLMDYAGGSLGRLTLALERGLTAWAGLVLPALEEMDRGRCPVELGRSMAQTIDEFAQGWIDDHAGASKEAANRLGAGLMLLVFTQATRRRLAALAQDCRGLDSLDAAAKLDPWLAVLDAVRSVEAELAANLNLGMVCDHLALLVHAALAGRDSVRVQ